jgi:hypothetical protein
MIDRCIEHDFDQLERLARKQLHVLHLMMENLMATQQQLIDKIAELGQDETGYQAREQAIVDALTKQVADLTALGNPDTQPAIDALNAIIATIPSAVAPAVTPTP